ncbi:MAG: SPOR domain-containing protein [Porticoccaceae bacterium]|nr:SPOR domain-containing protein [Porticoccaceae bacterium]
MMKGGSQEKGVVTLSWYCMKKPENHGQYCEKRRLRNGKPVDGVVYETMIIPDGKAPPPVIVAAAAQPPQSPSSGEAIPWARKSLTAVNAIDDQAAALAVENLGPEPRKPKNTVDLWGKRGRDKTEHQAAAVNDKDGEGREAVAEDKTPPKSVESKAPSLPVKEVAPQPQQKPQAKLQGYTVQLAAFATQKQCDTFMTNKKYRHLTLNKKKILSKGEPWWIVTHGQFASYGEALRISKQLSTQYAGINAWARSWSVIEKLASP